MSHPANELVISTIERADLPRLAELYDQLQPTQPSLAAMEDALCRVQGDPRHVVLAARIDGRLVGSLLGVACRMLYGRCRSFMVVEDVVVDCAFRRCGIGRALMDGIERRARELDCSYLMLMTDAERVDACLFYAALGYQAAPYRGFKKRLQP